MERVIVLHSGGLDSTVALLMAVEEGLTPVSLGIDYGQHHQIELTYAEQLCRKFGVERQKSVSKSFFEVAQSDPTGPHILKRQRNLTPLRSKAVCQVRQGFLWRCTKTV